MPQAPNPPFRAPFSLLSPRRGAAPRTPTSAPFPPRLYTSPPRPRKTRLPSSECPASLLLKDPSPRGSPKPRPTSPPPGPGPPAPLSSLPRAVRRPTATPLAPPQTPLSWRSPAGPAPPAPWTSGRFRRFGQGGLGAPAAGAEPAASTTARRGSALGACAAPASAESGRGWGAAGVARPGRAHAHASPTDPLAPSQPDISDPAVADRFFLSPMRDRPDPGIAAGGAWTRGVSTPRKPQRLHLYVGLGSLGRCPPRRLDLTRVLGPHLLRRPLVPSRPAPPTFLPRLTGGPSRHPLPVCADPRGRGKGVVYGLEVSVYYCYYYYHRSLRDVIPEESGKA